MPAAVWLPGCPADADGTAEALPPGEGNPALGMAGDDAPWLPDDGLGRLGEELVLVLGELRDGLLEELLGIDGDDDEELDEDEDDGIGMDEELDEDWELVDSQATRTAPSAVTRSSF